MNSPWCCSTSVLDFGAEPLAPWSCRAGFVVGCRGLISATEPLGGSAGRGRNPRGSGPPARLPPPALPTPQPPPSPSHSTVPSFRRLYSTRAMPFTPFSSARAPAARSSRGEAGRRGRFLAIVTVLVPPLPQRAGERGISWNYVFISQQKRLISSP